MKITFIATLDAYWGGSEVLWVQCAEFAIANGHQVQAVVYEQKSGLHPALVALKRIATSFVELKNDSRPSSLPGKALAAIKSRLVSANLNEVTAFSPDHLIINEVDNYSAPFHPLLYSFLSSYNKPFHLISQYNSEHQCLSWADIGKARFIFGKAANIFFVSERNRQVTERQIAMAVRNATIIDNPLNLSDPRYIKYPVGERINFASVARLEVQYKGQDVLLQVLSAPQWKERDWTLNIYGTGKDETYLKELCDFYGLSLKVTFHGHVNHVYEIWENNHVLLMPSTAEGKPLALEEAMICGRVAVASDVAGNAELVDDGVNGYIASSFFPKPFGARLEDAWNNKLQWEAMGIKAHEKMLATLDFKPHETVLKAILQ